RREDVFWTYSYSPIDDDEAENGVGGVLVVCNETTHHGAAQRGLKIELEWLSNLFDQAASFMAVLRGPEHRFELANARYFELIGNRQVLGLPIAQALPSAGAKGYIDLLDTVFRPGKAYTATGPRYIPEPAPGRPAEERYLDFVYQP